MAPKPQDLPQVPPQAPPESSAYRADVKITQLGETIGDPVAPAEFPKHVLRYRNDRWAATVGLDGLTDGQWIAHFGRLEPLPDNLDPPLAMRYHGHQFRVYNPDIGDGRGFLFAQLRDHEARLMDLGTKGSGQTPYSRTADGRLTLKGAVREILATELLEALGVHTSKTFSVVETGEELMRSDEPSPTRSAVLVRLNHSHIRIGTFQRAAYEGNAAMIRALVDYALTHLLEPAGEREPAIAFYEQVVSRCARLAAGFMASGFVHGVLNSDNINITGESFDYGPWRFNPIWDPQHTAAYFDHQGLYCFARQPEAIHWNLGQLGACLRHICDSDPLVAALESFPRQFGERFVEHICWRLGIEPEGFEADRPLVMAMEQALATEKTPLDRFFFDWHRPERPDAYGNPNFNEFAAMMRDRTRRSSTAHEFWEHGEPVGLPIETVEALWKPIAEDDDWTALYDHVGKIRELGTALRAE